MWNLFIIWCVNNKKETNEKREKTHENTQNSLQSNNGHAREWNAHFQEHEKKKHREINKTVSRTKEQSNKWCGHDSRANILCHCCRNRWICSFRVQYVRYRSAIGSNFSIHQMLVWSSSKTVPFNIHLRKHIDAKRQVRAKQWRKRDREMRRNQGNKHHGFAKMRKEWPLEVDYEDQIKINVSDSG